MDKNAPAFPVVIGTQADQHECGPGLTKREYFAGQALVGILAAGPPKRGLSQEDICRIAACSAFDLADAMLRESEDG